MLPMGAITTHAVAMSLYDKPGCDLEKDLLPVSLVADLRTCWWRILWYPGQSR